jgi:glycosyltransferase involved in cell wall biosynthesis
MTHSRRILYVQYVNPGMYPPLEQSSRIMADAGWQVRFVGTRSLGESDNLAFPPHPKVVVWRLPFYQPSGLRLKLHYLLFAAWVLAWVVLWRPRWVYLSDLNACPIGAMLAWLRVPLVYHEHDSPQPNGPRERVRVLIGRTAALCVLPNPVRAMRFVAATGRVGPTVCVFNCPRREEVGPPRETCEDTIRVLYGGSVVPERLPEAVVRAVALVRAVRLEVIGYETIGSRGYIARLRGLAAELGATDRVTFAPAMPRHELWAAIRHSDIGLALLPTCSDDPNLSAMPGASVKVFDYLSAGLGVLLADRPEWRADYLDAGLARGCDPADPASIAAALRWFADNPEETRAMGERGRQRVLADWNYETQFEPVKRLLEAL